METDQYTPHPIDTSHIQLSDEVLQLAELLAKNTHDIYVENRLAEGWTLGPRNDEKKTNPTLIPYECLSESEKEYDRKTSLETLKVILSLGYKMVLDK